MKKLILESIGKQHFKNLKLNYCIYMQKKPFVIIFTILGLIIGIVSLYLPSQLILFSLLAGTYLVILLPIAIKNKNDKILKNLILETLSVYLLTWLVVFFLLLNIL